MAITATEIVMQGAPWLRAWTVIATLDADTALTITPSSPIGMTAGTPVAIVLVPLTAMARISDWILSGPAYPATIAGFEITKTTTAGSGDAAPQLLVQMFAAPPLRLAHP